jgi:probable addiction module antidote protein
MKPTRSYKEWLFKRIKDPEKALGYLRACLEDGDERVFLIALKDVADAHGGLTKFSRVAGLTREHLYRMLSRKGNPSLSSLASLLGALGFRLSIDLKRPAKPSRLKKAA